MRSRSRRTLAARSRYGPPSNIPGIPSDAALEKEGAVIGEVLVDNQNIFNLDDPKDDNKIFRLADRLHIKTRASVVRKQLLFKPGDRYSRRLVRGVRAPAARRRLFLRRLDPPGGLCRRQGRSQGHHQGRLDAQPRLQFRPQRRHQLHRREAPGGQPARHRRGADLSYQSTVDRSGSSVDLSDRNAFGSWTAVDVNYGNFSDGHQRGLNVTRPFYALDSRWAASGAALDDTQTDPLYDLGKMVDQFQDRHELVQAYYGWSTGLQNGWVQRWTAGITYDEHRFAPVSNSNGTTNLLPADRRFVYPFIEWDIVQDDYLKLFNHDQIGRTEDFSLGTPPACGWDLRSRASPFQQRAPHDRFGQPRLARRAVRRCCWRGISPGGCKDHPTERATRCVDALLRRAE